MTKFKYLKLSAVSLICVLSSMSFANAGQVNIHNIDIPHAINGTETNGTVIFMTNWGGLKTTVSVPPIGHNADLHPIPDGDYMDISMIVNTGRHSTLSASCYHNPAKPFVVTKGMTGAKAIGINVRYEATKNRVTCAITTPH